jgi:hypothetical protein
MKLNRDGTWELERDDDAIPCPKCGGYASRVKCAPEELEKYNCGRSWECCARAFECRVCGHREATRAPAPEMT